MPSRAASPKPSPNSGWVGNASTSHAAMNSAICSTKPRKRTLPAGHRDAARASRLRPQLADARDEQAQVRTGLRGVAEGVDEHVVTLALDESGRDADHHLVRGEPQRGPGRRPLLVGAGEAAGVHPVPNGADAVGGSETLVADEPGDVLGDRDAARAHAPHRTAGGPVGVAEVEVGGGVHRRDARAAGDRRGQLPVHVGVDEVRVHDVGIERTDLAHEPGQQRRVQVPPTGFSGDVHAGGPQLLDEPLAVAGDQHVHAHVDARRRQRGQEEEQVALRAPDALDPLHVQDPQRVVRHRWTLAASSVATVMGPGPTSTRGQMAGASVPNHSARCGRTSASARAERSRSETVGSGSGQGIASSGSSQETARSSAGSWGASIR